MDGEVCSDVGLGSGYQMMRARGKEEKKKRKIKMKTYYSEAEQFNILIAISVILSLIASIQGSSPSSIVRKAGRGGGYVGGGERALHFIHQSNQFHLCRDAE